MKLLNYTNVTFKQATDRMYRIYLNNVYIGKITKQRDDFWLLKYFGASYTLLRDNEMLRICEFVNDLNNT